MASQEQTVASQPHYAGFWIRVPAMLIDGALLWALFIVLFLVSLFIASSFLSQGDLQGFGWLIVFILMFVIPLFSIGYFAFMESKYGASLGKCALGLKVVTENGQKLTFARALGRATAKVFFLFLALPAAGLIIGAVALGLAGWTAKKQALHDLIAGTIVVYKK